MTDFQWRNSEKGQNQIPPLSKHFHFTTDWYDVSGFQRTTYLTREISRNTGPRIVRRWKKRQFALTPDLDIAMLPYSFNIIMKFTLFQSFQFISYTEF